MGVNAGRKVKFNFHCNNNHNHYTSCVTQTTPLILASKNGHEKCVKLLLQQPHVDVTFQDDDGYNCLAFAALNRHLYVYLIGNCI